MRKRILRILGRALATSLQGRLRCYDTTLILLEYEIVAMGRRSRNVDVAVMR
jgi:hypothetical protein